MYNQSMEKLDISRKELEAFCRKYRIQKLAFFGSVLRGDFSPTSDVDVIIEFEKGYTPGLAFFAMPDELKKILGRNVDLLTYQGIRASKNPIRRKAILESAKVYYVAG
jgi:predicted nucleotidyltransferase